MIRSLRGTLAAAGPEGALVEVGGVGLLVHVSAHTLDALPPAGSAVRLETHLVVREDALDLYGFSGASERELFEAFIGVSGVGPRLALSLCGLDRPETLRHAIATGDARRLQRAPGVGKRTAERLVLELRDRLGAVGGDPRADGVPGAPPAGPAAEAHEAMLALGYAPDEAALALAGAPPDLDAAALVRHGLARMRRT
ncbi:MAG TPA: Holliday junction branch migration protein RuvA [Miltoncostaeaceae bacterium]|nr:Holliday junction branch migration protein RuvA [Miltoncostaeaceae bacterium]